MEDCIEIKIKCGDMIINGRIWYEYLSENADVLTLYVKGEGIFESAQAPDCFSALTEVRKKLEKMNVFLLVMGANEKVYPSPMQQNMGDGRNAYIQRMGKPAMMSDCIDIFAPCDYEYVSTVGKQQQYHTRWISEKVQR